MSPISAASTQGPPRELARNPFGPKRLIRLRAQGAAQETHIVLHRDRRLMRSASGRPPACRIHAALANSENRDQLSLNVIPQCSCSLRTTDSGFATVSS